MIHVKAIAKKNPQKPEADPLFYASAVHEEMIDMDSFAKLITERCSLRRSDVYALLVTITDLIPELLADGKLISLGELGTFSVNVKSDAAESAEKLNRKHIKGLSIIYRPTKYLTKKMATSQISIIR